MSTNWSSCRQAVHSAAPGWPPQSQAAFTHITQLSRLSIYAAPLPDQPHFTSTVIGKQSQHLNTDLTPPPHHLLPYLTQSCNEYQLEQLQTGGAEYSTRQALAESGWQQCPQCGMAIERVGGCRHITCRDCHYDFW